MNLSGLPNWRLCHKIVFIILCWTVFSAYYYVKNQFELPPLDVRELLGSLPVFALAAHGTFFFLNRFFVRGKRVVGIVGLAVWHTAVFFLAYFIVNLVNPYLPHPFLEGEAVPLGNPAFLNSTITSLVNFSVVGLVFFLVYRTVFSANAQRMEAEGKLAAMRKQAEAEAEKEHYEYLALAGQVSPHFIINMLLDWKAKLGNDNREEAKSMQQLYALLLYHGRAREPGREVVPLQEEIDYMASFLALLGNTNKEMFITTEIEGCTAGYTIPPTTLIAFVDNAYKHGVTDDPAHPARISARISNHTFRFSCHNKVNGRACKTSHGIGLANARRRLRIQYRDSYDLESQEQDGNYFMALTIRF